MREHDDETIRHLKRLGIPVTRENYLELAYFGDPPPPSAELEASLPKRLRRPLRATRIGANPPPTDELLERLEHVL